MKLYSINLTAIPDGWRLFSIRKADKKFLPFKQKILERDNYICRFCGIPTRKHHEIINLDNNYRNNKVQNLVTACRFCSQCYFLDAIGNGEARSGELIYLPELSQKDLNAMCHVLFRAMFYESHRYSTTAWSTYNLFKSRKEIIEKRLGEGMSDASYFGRLLLDISDSDRRKVEQNLLPFIRLLPIYEEFIDIIADLSGALGESIF